MTSRRFNRFIRSLADVPGGDDLLNPWFDDGSRENRVRRANLRRYLSRIDELGVSTIFVGEALGHRGGRISGVPFTSIDLLLDGSHRLLGSDAGFTDPGDADGFRREASATMIWGAIARLPHPPLLWNACPFHPHRPGNPRSNRKPRSDEIAMGERYLGRLARLCRITRFVAVGRVASATLDCLGIPHDYVRHPSIGGKREFERGLTSLFGSVEPGEGQARQSI